MRTAGSSPAGKAVWLWRLARVLLGVLALLVVTGCAGTGRALPAARAIRSCGPGRVPGYGNHRSYPPGIPTLPPPGARIIGCFAGPAQAAARGFPLPVPAGTVIVRGVFLLPTGAVMRSQCKSASRRLGFAVPCPGLLPSPSVTPLQLPNCGTVSACVWKVTTPPASQLFLFDDGFVAPPGYHGVGGMAAGHVVLLAERAAQVKPAGNGLLFCLTQPALRMLTIDGDRATVAACPEGSYQTGGHVVLYWVHRGVLAGVSFHGVNATNIALDLAVARHMTWVGPLS
jgi:hypothetical protein